MRALLTVPLWSDDADTLCAGRSMGLSRWNSYRAANSGDIPTLRVNGRFLVSTRVLLELIDDES